MRDRQNALERSVVLVDATGSATADRIRLSGGVRRVDASEAQRFNYQSAAFVPAGGWHAPSATALSALCSGVAHWEPGKAIAIVKVPTALLNALRESRRQGGIDAVQENVARAIQGLAPFCSTADGLVYLGAAEAPSGLPTITYDDRRAGCPLTGLHVDNWEGSAGAGRDCRRNRLCLNMGAEPRYFLFINLTLAYVRQWCGGSEGMSGNELASALMARFGGYPVVRLRLDPGEAYIAPTENMIHDATTEEMRTPDVKVTLLGRFCPG